MTLSTPITIEDLSSLPDNSAEIESIVESDDVMTVVPRFMGTAETGRFVTSYFEIKDTTLSLYSRKSARGLPGEIEFIESIELDHQPERVGGIWDQTLFFEEPDGEAVEWVKQRANYETIWLTQGDPPSESFFEWATEPYSHEATGLPDCEDHEMTKGFQPPNIDINIICCPKCEMPLFATAGGTEPYSTDEILQASFVGISSAEEETDVRGVPVEAGGSVSNREIALHILTRYAMLETDRMDLYVRDDQKGYLILMGDLIVGYAMWSEHGDYTALQQRYLLPDFRGNRLGTVLLEAWYDYIDSDWYYTIQSNEAARKSLEASGHIDQDTARPANILSSRDTNDPARISPGFVDRQRRQSLERGVYE
jgi:GNAT superfamily N-acetyltransferase